MCGISAIVSLRPASLAGLIHAMTNVIRHRGPDDEGYGLFHMADRQPNLYGGIDTPKETYHSHIPYAPAAPIEAAQDDTSVIALGHRRLSIQDISPSGHQPMSGAKGRYWIVFNGEIYNFIELREELQQLGHVFHTQTDTEVLLAAYAEWGRACLHRFNGMFSFLLFDTRSQVLFAARDRFGVKPLYYWISAEGYIAFASEIKQFSVLPGWSAHVNAQRAYDFLNWSLIDHTHETLFRGVYQLRNGEALELQCGVRLEIAPSAFGGTLSTYQWYKLEPRQFSGSFSDAAHRFCELLTDSVRLRLRADVPVGSCLSGGLDSSSIVCAMNMLLQVQDARALQKTFSACADVPRFDEREFIDEVTRHTKTEAHHVYPPLDRLFGTLDAITHHQDEPFGSTSIYAQWCVFGLAHSNAVKVMLDGQGADELLGGYHSYFSPHLARLARLGQWSQLWREMKAVKSAHGYSTLWLVEQTMNNLLPEIIRQPLRTFAGKSSISPPWIDFSRLAARPLDPFFVAGGAKCVSVRALSHAQLTHTNVQMLLHWEDRNSMAHSVEARVPFLDYRLVEFALGLPDEFKIRDGVTKLVLRESMRSFLPERIRNRMDKLGFVTPEEVWLREQNPGGFRRALLEAVDASAGILNSKAFSFLEDVIDGRRPFNFAIWRWISFGKWMKVFDVKP
jgi:asparagine synthase (glutamine-hydrolysing)